MDRPACYDVTRLLTRVFNATPNGIDRIDLELARHFLGATGDDFSSGDRLGLVTTPIGMRLIEGEGAAKAIAAIAAHWREGVTDVGNDAAYRRVVAFLGGENGETLTESSRRRRPRPVGVGGTAAWLKRYVPSLRTPSRHLPSRSIYLNASQFPLWMSSPFAWLPSRPDVRAAFFIHDLLPISLPEYFLKGEHARHIKRLENFARFAAAGIVTTWTVASELDEHLRRLGRCDCPIFVAPTPVAPIFATPRVTEPALSSIPYFVLCSTLEPRKNHMMLLAVWRALVQKLGKRAPKLLLVGARGWHFDPIVDLIGRSQTLRDHVLEVRGLSTPALKRLIDNARALLMPSFGEGYGLPVREALTAGATVIASDIPAFREIEAAGLTRLSPLDGEGWLAAIEELAGGAHRATSTYEGDTGYATYFDRLDHFLDQL